MSRDDVIRLAKEAGFRIFGNKIVAADESSSGLATQSIERFAYLVAAAERERCINVAGLVRLGLSQRYDENIKNDSAIMVGNTDWFRLTGAVRVVEALCQLRDE